ncbi:MAG: helix-turn-helix domain-containing protein [Patescibacteria group bacterium]|jgi:cytoskeletal protein RodZ
MGFVMRKLSFGHERLGDRLRSLRRGQAVSLEMLETETHIQERYFSALERGMYEVLPEPLYTRNIIRAYARALHADEAYFLERYEEERGSCDCVSHLCTPVQRLRAVKLFVLNRFVKLGVLAIVAFGVFGYLGWQIQAIIAPPEVVLLSPVNDSMTSKAIVPVEGIVDEETTVYVNGVQVPVSEDQTFETSIDLQKGMNVILVEAERRYSRRAVLERTVVFYPESVPQVTFISP